MPSALAWNAENERLLLCSFLLPKIEGSRSNHFVRQTLTSVFSKNILKFLFRQLCISFRMGSPLKPSSNFPRDLLKRVTAATSIPGSFSSSLNGPQPH